jgi:DNA-binding XRE family transcriptional regulator
MTKQVTRDRNLTPEEAEKYRRIRAEIESEKPAIIAKARQARRNARRRQLADIMQQLNAAREAMELSLADVYQRTGIDRAALSKLENVTNENPTLETLLRYAEVVGKRLEIHVVDKPGRERK